MNFTVMSLLGMIICIVQIKTIPNYQIYSNRKHQNEMREYHFGEDTYENAKIELTVMQKFVQDVLQLHYIKLTQRALNNLFSNLDVNTIMENPNKLSIRKQAEIESYDHPNTQIIDSFDQLRNLQNEKQNTGRFETKQTTDQSYEKPDISSINTVPTTIDISANQVAFDLNTSIDTLNVPDRIEFNTSNLKNNQSLESNNYSIFSQQSTTLNSIDKFNQEDLILTSNNNPSNITLKTENNMQFETYENDIDWIDDRLSKASHFDNHIITSLEEPTCKANSIFPINDSIVDEPFAELQTTNLSSDQLRLHTIQDTHTADISHFNYETISEQPTFEANRIFSMNDSIANEPFVQLKTTNLSSDQLKLHTIEANHTNDMFYSSYHPISNQSTFKTNTIFPRNHLIAHQPFVELKTTNLSSDQLRLHTMQLDDTNNMVEANHTSHMPYSDNLTLSM